MRISVGEFRELSGRLMFRYLEVAEVPGILIRMMTGDERDALQAHSTAYREWGRSRATLKEVVSSRDSKPRQLKALEINAMAAEFEASRETVRTAIEYVNACSALGPDIEGLVGSAFVVALVQAVREELACSLGEDLGDLASAQDQWLSEAAVWVPSSGDPFAPARPSTPVSIRRVYAAARDLDEHRRERARESLIAGFAETGRPQGLEVREKAAVYRDSLTRQITEIGFGRDEPHQIEAADETSEVTGLAMMPGDKWPSTGFSGFLEHWREGSKGSWRVLCRNELSIEFGVELSSHRRGVDAFEAAHRARQHIDRDAVIDIVEWRTSGWLLCDTMPALSSDEVDEKSGAEVIFGYRVDEESLFDGATLIESYPVALLLPFHAGWQILVASPVEPEVFECPTTMKDALYGTRMAAIAGVRSLAGMK